MGYLGCGIVLAGSWLITVESQVQYLMISYEFHIERSILESVLQCSLLPENISSL